MLEKLSLKFNGIIGSNDSKMTTLDLARLLLELENEFNTKFSHCRLHLNMYGDPPEEHK